MVKILTRDEQTIGYLEDYAKRIECEISRLIIKKGSKQSFVKDYESTDLDIEHIAKQVSDYKEDIPMHVEEINSYRVYLSSLKEHINVLKGDLESE